MVALGAGSVPLTLGIPAEDADWLTPDRLQSLPDTLFFHARDKLLEGLAEDRFRLLTALADHAAGAGWQVRSVDYSGRGHELALANPRHLHVFLEDRPGYAPNAVYAVPAYLHGFWFFDEIGSRNNSTQRLARFEPNALNADRAHQFHARLHARIVGANRSKFEQEPRGAVPVEPGCLAFFAQEFQPPKHHRHFLTVPEMIRAAIAAKGARRLYIKPHPKQRFDEVEVLSGFHDPAAGVELTHASIHDLLAVCDCALSVTSAVGFEAFLHRKPVVLGGQTDFWHNAVTLTRADQMADAMAASMARDWPHEKFLLWYLRRMCHDDSPEALPGVLAKLYRKGFSFADPGQGWF